MDLSTLRGWLFDRVLSHNPSEKVIYILLRYASSLTTPAPMTRDY